MEGMGAEPKAIKAILSGRLFIVWFQPNAEPE